MKNSKQILPHKSGGGFTLPSGKTFQNFTIPSKILVGRTKADLMKIKKFYPLTGYWCFLKESKV